MYNIGKSLLTHITVFPLDCKMYFVLEIKQRNTKRILPLAITLDVQRLIISTYAEEKFLEKCIQTIGIEYDNALDVLISHQYFRVQFHIYNVYIRLIEIYFAIFVYLFSIEIICLPQVLRLVRVTRILRVFKLVRHFAGLQSLFSTLVAACKELGLLIMLVGVTVLTFSSLIYFAEKDDQDWSFMEAFWWGLLTITTVGYGKFCGTREPEFNL